LQGFFTKVSLLTRTPLKSLTTQAVLLLSHYTWAHPNTQSEDIIARFVNVRSVDNVLQARAHAPVPPHVKEMKRDADIAHGVLMGCAVALFLPLGSLTTRLVKNRHMLWIHVACQTVGMAVFLGGFATGVWTSINHNEVKFNGFLIASDLVSNTLRSLLIHTRHTALRL
jgi:hypothetical protein